MRKNGFTLSVIASALLSSGLALAATSNPINQAWQCDAVKGAWICHGLNNAGVDLYAVGVNAAQKQQALAQALGWVPDNSQSGSCSACNGHYYQEPVPGSLHASQSFKTAMVHVKADTYNYQLRANTYVAQGHVEISQPGRILYADQALVKVDPHTHAEYLQVDGNVKVRQPGVLLLASSGQADAATHKAELDNVTYLLNMHPAEAQIGDSNFTGYARGQSKTIVQLDQDLYRLSHASYTTCPPTNDTWNLTASTIELDTASGRGHAYNTVLWLQGFPAFYFPYFSFPLSDKRQSGFLYGNLGTSSTTGSWMSVPYYFNLAPNYDWTLDPIFYTTRGVMLNNEFRYLGPRSNAQLEYDYMPNDRQDDMSHTSINFNSQTQLAQNWQLSTNYNYVSDLDYQLNYNNSANTASQYQFTQQATLQYSGVNWNFTGLMQGYQVLGNDIYLANIPYNRLPEFDLNAQYPGFLGPLSFGFTSQFVNFQKSMLSNNPAPVEGQRSNAAPAVSLPLVASYGYFIPNITLSGTQYNLSNTEANPSYAFPNSSVSRTLPIFNIDTGLNFRRTFLWNSQGYSQTLSPRLFYLYVPYQNQSNIPVFDTGIQDFTYASLFSTNRFTGIDRIGDANQLSAALSTSINDASGSNILNAAIGQIVYFENRQVSLCTNQPGQAPCIETEQPEYNLPRSDMAGEFNYNFNASWSFNSGMTYNTFSNQVDYQNYQMQYHMDPKHLINFGYQSNRYEYSLLTNQQLISGTTPPPNLAQITGSFIWELVPQWSMVGLANYSLDQGLMINIFGGVQYSSCCWSIAFLQERYVTSNNPNDPSQFSGPTANATVIQFELKGLGSTSSQSGTLLTQIPGYNPNQSGI